MYKSNSERNGKSLVKTVIKGIEQVQWRVDDIRLASANKDIVLNSGYLYLIGMKGVSMSASFYKIDIETGTIHSSIEIEEKVFGEGTYFSSPVVSNGLAYFLYQPTVSRISPQLYCINTSSFEVVFKTDIHKSMEHLYVDGSVDSFKRSVRSSILLVEHSVYIGTGNGCVCSFSAQTGEMQWALPISEDYAMGHISYSDGFLYVESSSRSIYSIDVEKRLFIGSLDAKKVQKYISIISTYFL